MTKYAFDEEEVVAEAKAMVTVTKAVMCGESIELSSNILGIWTFPPGAIGNYVVGDNSGYVVPVPSGTTQQPTIFFPAPGIYPVSFRPIDPRKSSTTIEFIATQPSCTISVVIATPRYDAGLNALILAGQGNQDYGVLFQGTLNNPSSYTLEMGFLQLVKPMRGIIDTGMHERVCPGNGTWFVDTNGSTAGIYNDATMPAWPGTTTLSSGDRPSLALGPASTGLSPFIAQINGESFQIYLVYRVLNRGPNIWVPAVAMWWNWTVQAGFFGNSWNVTSQNSAQGPLNIAIMPVWQGFVATTQNLDWGNW